MNPDNIYSIEFDFIGLNQEELESYITFNDNGELVNEENQLQTGGSELFQSNTKKIKGRGKATDWVLKSNFSSNDSFEESEVYSKINSGFLKLHKSSQNKRFYSIKTYWYKFSSKRSWYDCPFKSRIEVNHDGSLNYLEKYEQHSHSLLLDAKWK